MTRSLSKGRLWLGLAAGILMIASGALHSIAGWPGLKSALSGTNTPQSVVAGLAVPWHLAGTGMMMFGLLVILDMLAAHRGSETRPPTNRVIGGFFLVFGLVGLVAIKLDPTFAMFIVPGLMALSAK